MTPTSSERVEVRSIWQVVGCRAVVLGALVLLASGCGRGCGGEPEEEQESTGQHDREDSVVCERARADLERMPQGDVFEGPSIALQREELSAVVERLVAAEAPSAAWLEAFREADASGTVFLAEAAAVSPERAREVAAEALMRERRDLALRFAAAHHLARGGGESVAALGDVISRHEGGAGDDRTLGSGVMVAAQFPVASREVLFGPEGVCRSLARQRECAVAAVEMGMVDPDVFLPLEPRSVARVLEGEVLRLRGRSPEAWGRNAAGLEREHFDLLVDSLERLEQAGFDDDTMMRVRLRILAENPRQTSRRQWLVRGVLAAGAALAQEQELLERAYAHWEADAQPAATQVAALFVSAGLELPESARERLRTQAEHARGQSGVMAALAWARHSGEGTPLRGEGSEVSSELLAAVAAPTPDALVALVEAGELPSWQLVHAAMFWAAGRWGELAEAAVAAEVRNPVWGRVAARLGEDGAPLTLALVDAERGILVPGRALTHVREEVREREAYVYRVMDAVHGRDAEALELGLGAMLELNPEIDLAVGIEALMQAGDDEERARLADRIRRAWMMMVLRGMSPRATTDLRELTRLRTQRVPQGPAFRELSILLHNAWMHQCMGSEEM